MAEEMKHTTPGPWKASQTYPQGDWCIHAEGIPWQLAYVPASTQIDWPLEANARLIAAAPAMLDALKALLAAAEMTTFSDQYPRECEIARAAIADSGEKE